MLEREVLESSPELLVNVDVWMSMMVIYFTENKYVMDIRNVIAQALMEGCYIWLSILSMRVMEDLESTGF